MTAQALYRKWRPRTFDQVVGQEHVVHTLRNALVSGRVRHAYLFAGPRGTGKTTTARLLAKAVNCLAPEEERPCNECRICVAINEGRLLDLIEIDAASNTGVDDVRDLRERVGFRPNEARYKVYVIDEVHMLSNAAFNALLKTLEEPPAHAIFVLATTEPHKIPATVVSRCQRFDFRRISVGEIVNRLAWLADQEGIQVERPALELIARQATGSMRDAESLLDQLASYDEGGITVRQMRAALGIGADETVIRLTEALAAGDVAQGLGVINLAVEEGADPRQFARQVVEHLRVLLLLRLESGVMPPYVSEASLPSLRDQATAFSRRQLIRAVRLFNQAAQEAKGGWQPQLPLEMAFVEALLPREPDDEGGGDPSSGRTGGARSVRRGMSGSGRGTASSASPRAAGPARSEPLSGQHAGPPAQTDPSQTVREPTTSTYRAVGDGDSPLTPAVVVEHWPDFLNALRPEDLKLEALMRSCEPVGVEGEVIVLRFAHEFHRSKVEEQAKRRLIEDALSNLFGRRLRVRCVVDWQGEAGPLQADHRPDPAPRPGVSEGGTLAAFDPLVQMAVDELGAEVASG